MKYEIGGNTYTNDEIWARNEEVAHIPFWDKVKSLLPAGFITWLIILTISLLLDHSKWGLNVAITLGMIVLTTLGMTTFEGSDADGEMP